MAGRRWRVVVPVVAAGAGLLFGISATTSRGTDLRPGVTNLVGVVRTANTRVADQQQHLRSLRTEIDGLTRASHEGSGIGLVSQRADALAPQAGLTAVSGAAVRVTLTDSTRDLSSLPENGTADWLVVHQQDVQAVVNALWRGGASAIMLMDQRIISTSAVRCVGNTLILQGRVYSPPFTITALGNQRALRAALDADPTVQNYRAYVDLAGLGYQVQEPTVTMPAYTGSLTMRAARALR